MFRICKGKAEYYNSMFYEMSSFAKNYPVSYTHLTLPTT